jgi:hypothetical protein
LFAEWFSIPALLATHFGFAALLGRLLNHARRQPPGMVNSLAVGLASLAFIAANLGLPWGVEARLAIWVLAVAVLVVFARQPARLPAWLWSASFGLRYAGVVMGLIILWGISNGLASMPLTLSGLAAIAGGLAWMRSQSLHSV